MSSRENQQFGPYGAYTVDETARRYISVVSPGGATRVMPGLAEDPPTTAVAGATVARNVRALAPSDWRSTSTGAVAVSCSDGDRVRKVARCGIHLLDHQEPRL